MISFEDKRDRLSRDLAGASARGEVFALFQPQFSLETSQIVGAELLSRWHHPDFGMIPPGVFIPLAEVTGTIAEVGNQMLEVAARALGRWGNEHRTVDLAVNVSLLQVAAKDFGDHLLGVLRNAGAPVHRLVAEITESTPYSSIPQAVERLSAIAASGVTVSLDDFGSGYSTQAQVRALPATELKIDQRLVHDESAVGIKRMAKAVEFGKERGMRIVAEGIETVEQLDRVRELRVDRAQGYLLGMPMEEVELLALLAHQT